MTAQVQNGAGTKFGPAATGAFQCNPPFNLFVCAGDPPKGHARIDYLQPGLLTQLRDKRS
jgi:hypothetical protein